MQCNDPLTKTPKLTRAKRITEWTFYDREVTELAKKLLKQDGDGRDGRAGEVVDESMFVQIDSSSQKEPVVDTKEESQKENERVKDEL